MMVGRFVEVCGRRGVKVSAGRRKVLLCGEEGLECEVHADGTRLEFVIKFKYLGRILNELVKDGVECRCKVVSGRKGTGALRSLVNARSLQLECSGVL